MRFDPHMMPHDYSSVPSSPLAPETVSALRVALERYVEDRKDGQHLRAALSDIAREARRRDLHAEQMLIVVKHVWYSLPSLRRLDELTEQNSMLQRVVTTCIKEYYAD